MHEIYMKRALELAEKGVGYVSPNPLVGAVIVKDGRIIGEGWHEFYGGNHAEVNAFNNAIEDVKGATMYVTLEPCSHYGKTPPCANAIVEKGIKKVVIGLKDPNPLVSGRGIQILKDNNIEVITGVLEEKGRKQNEIFLKYIITRLPYCLMKAAMTLDGKIATYTGDSRWVSNESSRKYTHKLRHRYKGIMAGIGTILKDNPTLNTRLDKGKGCDPVRIIVDSKARTPLDAKVLNIESQAGAIIVVTELASTEKIKALEDKGAEVIVSQLKNGQVDLNYLMKALGEKNIDSVLLEGGGTLNYSALQASIVDKVNVFIAPKLIGGASAMTPVGGEGISFMKDAITLKDIEIYRFDEDIMLEGYI